MKANKNKILLATLIPASALSAIAIATPALVGCSCGNKNQINFDSSDCPETLVMKTNLVLNKQSTIELTIPDGEYLDTTSIRIEVGNYQLVEDTDYIVAQPKGSKNKYLITISASAMNDTNVVLHCSYEQVVKAYQVNDYVSRTKEAPLCIDEMSESLFREEALFIKATMTDMPGTGSIKIYSNVSKEVIGSISLEEKKKGDVIDQNVSLKWEAVQVDDQINVYWEA